MKPIKNQASSIAGQSALSAEAKLCFGAAGGSAVLGVAGYALNTLTSMETTLSAFLVISVFYLLMGVISFFSHSTECVQSPPAEKQVRPIRNNEEALVESAA